MQKLVSLVLLLLCLTATPVGAANGVVVLVDDMATADLAYLPRLRAAFAQGVTFSQGIATSPLCAPSRVTMLTGRYTRNHHIETNNVPDGGWGRMMELGTEAETIGVWAQATHRTAYIGKYVNKYGVQDPTYIPPGWDRWIAPTHRKYQSFNYLYTDQGVEYPGHKYQTDFWRRNAVNFIRTTDEPFFMVVAPTAPHHPQVAPARHRNVEPPVFIPPLGFDELDLSDKPSHIRNNPVDVPYNRLIERFNQRIGSLLAVEDLVLSIIDALRYRNILDDTIIIFVSDNGYTYDEHGVGMTKSVAFEGAITVPFMVLASDAVTGTRAPLVTIADIAPTIGDYLGFEVPTSVDGRSLRPVITETAATWRKRVMIENYNANQFVGVRQRQAKYVLHANGEEELYMLRRDPGELRSRHAAPEWQETKNKMITELSALLTCSGADCRAAED